MEQYKSLLSYSMTEPEAVARYRFGPPVCQNQNEVGSNLIESAVIHKLLCVPGLLAPSPRSEPDVAQCPTETPSSLTSRWLSQYPTSRSQRAAAHTLSQHTHPAQQTREATHGT